MTPIDYAPEAIEDLQGIVEFLGEQSASLVDKFESDYRKAIQRLRDSPRGWPKVGRTVRVKIVSKRFKYGIFYQYSRGTI